MLRKLDDRIALRSDDMVADREPRNEHRREDECPGRKMTTIQSVTVGSKVQAFKLFSLNEEQETQDLVPVLTTAGA